MRAHRTVDRLLCGSSRSPRILIARFDTVQVARPFRLGRETHKTRLQGAPECTPRRANLFFSP